MAAVRAFGNWLPALRRKVAVLAAGGARSASDVAVGTAGKATSKAANKAASKAASKATSMAAGKVAGKADKAVLGVLDRSAVADIVRSHAPILAKRPHLLELKFEKMAESPFAFFRGTPGLFYRDVERMEGRKMAQGARTLLVGDLHVENFGAFAKRGGKITFGMNDFDEALLGPARLDLLRMASSIVLAGKSAGLGPDKTHDLVRGFATRYSKHLQEAAKGTKGAKGRAVKASGSMKRFLKEASEADFGKWIDALAPKVHGKRAFARGKTVLQANPDTARHLASAYEDYLKGLPKGAAEQLAGYRIVDAVSSAAGNASVGRGRYRLLLDAQGKRPIVLEFKEQVQSVLAPFLGDSRALGAPAERVVRISRTVRRKLNPFLSTAKLPASDGLGKGSYMVRRLYPTDKKISADRLGGAGEFAEFLDMAAFRVAQAHSRGEKLGGASAADILAALPGNGTLAKDLDTFGHKYALQVERDFTAFKKALATDPLLRSRL